MLPSSKLATTSPGFPYDVALQQASHYITRISLRCCPSASSPLHHQDFITMLPSSKLATISPEFHYDVALQQVSHYITGILFFLKEIYAIKMDTIKYYLFSNSTALKFCTQEFEYVAVQK